MTDKKIYHPSNPYEPGCCVDHKAEKCLVLLFIFITLGIVIAGLISAWLLPGSRTSQTLQWSSTEGANPMHTNSIDSIDLFANGALPQAKTFLNLTNPTQMVIDSYWRLYVRNKTGTLDVFDSLGHQLWVQEDFLPNVLLSGDNKRIYGFQSTPLEIRTYSPESGKLRDTFNGSSTYFAMSELVAAHSDVLYTTLQGNNGCYFSCLSTTLVFKWFVIIPGSNICSNLTVTLSNDQKTAFVGGSTNIYEIDIDSESLTRTTNTCDIFSCRSSSISEKLRVIIAGDSAIIYTFENQVICIDTESYTVLWNVSLSIFSKYDQPSAVSILASSVPIEDPSIFVVLLGNSDKSITNLQGINMTTGEVVWRLSISSIDNIFSRFSAPSIVQKSGYVCGDNNQLYHFDIETGKIIGQTSLKYQFTEEVLPCAYIDERGVLYVLTHDGLEQFSTDDVSTLPKVKWGATTILIFMFIMVMVWWSLCSLVGMFAFQNQPIGLVFASFISSNELVELVLNIVAQKPVTRKICACIKFTFRFHGRIYFLFLFLFEKLVLLIIAIILQRLYQHSCFGEDVTEPSYWQCGASAASIIRQAFFSAIIGIPLNVIATIIVGFCVRTLRLQISLFWKIIIHVVCASAFIIEVTICILLIILEKHIFFSILFTWILSIIVDLVTTPVIRAILCGDTKIARTSQQNALHYFWYGPSSYASLN